MVVASGARRRFYTGLRLPACPPACLPVLNRYGFYWHPEQASQRLYAVKQKPCPWGPPESDRLPDAGHLLLDIVLVGAQDRHKRTGTR